MFHLWTGLTLAAAVVAVVVEAAGALA